MALDPYLTHTSSFVRSNRADEAYEEVQLRQLIAPSHALALASPNGTRVTNSHSVVQRR